MCYFLDLGRRRARICHWVVGYPGLAVPPQVRRFSLSIISFSPSSLLLFRDHPVFSTPRYQLRSLHSQLSISEQHQALDAAGRGFRKIVLVRVIVTAIIAFAIAVN